MTITSFANIQGYYRYEVTNEDIIEDEIDAVIVMAELTGYAVTKTNSDENTIIYKFIKGKDKYQLHVNYAVKDSGNTVYGVWIKKMKQNLLVSSQSSPNNDLTFPLKVFKMIL